MSIDNLLCLCYRESELKILYNIMNIPTSKNTVCHMNSLGPLKLLGCVTSWPYQC